MTRSFDRIILILPCCIGDVVMATAALRALRRAYPHAQIAWAVGRWSRPVIEDHPFLNQIIDVGDRANPAKSAGGLLRLARTLRAGRYDAAVSLVRSPLMSAAVLLSGIPVRAGLDSGGRGFGYTVRVPIAPNVRRHEVDIYLDVVRAVGVDAAGISPFVPVRDHDRAAVRAVLDARGIRPPYLVVNPAGGRNPGMTMDAKRYPPPQMAALANQIAAAHDASVVVIGARDDAALIDAVTGRVSVPAAHFAGTLTFGQIGALAAGALVYLGNDTGLTHYAAAAGALTAMIMGPTDPRRYAPYADHAIALWKAVPVPERGAAAGAPPDWDWERDGISAAAAAQQIAAFLAARL